MIQLTDVHKTFEVKDRKTRSRRRIEAVKNLFECAIGWAPWNFTTRDAADLSDELRADRDTAIRAIRGYV